MKRLTKALLIMFTTLSTTTLPAQQWITNGSNIYNSNAGNVGIGTSSPQSNLHASSETAGKYELLIESDVDNNNENNNPYITFKYVGFKNLTGVIADCMNID